MGDDRAERLAAWLAARLGVDDIVVGALQTPEHGGLSADTLLVEASWDGEPGRAGFAVRLEPEDGIFPTYDLGGEFALLRDLRERTDVPAVPVRWFEPDPDVLGRPFYVADRVPGRVPPDDPPFQFGGWLYDATPEQQAQAQRSTIEALAAVHRLDAAGMGLRVPARERFGVPGIEQDLAYWRAYLDWTQEDGPVPLLEAAHAWCVSFRPLDEPPVSLCWGDARYGNVVFDGFAAAALLDWEMALLGPAELDLGWLLFLHETTLLWADELPGFAPRDELVATYQDVLGREVDDLDWYVAWAGFRAAAIQPKLTVKRYQAGEVADLSQRHENAVTHHLRQLIPSLPPPTTG